VSHLNEIKLANEMIANGMEAAPELMHVLFFKKPNKSNGSDKINLINTTGQKTDKGFPMNIN